MSRLPGSREERAAWLEAWNAKQAARAERLAQEVARQRKREAMQALQRPPKTGW